MSIDAPAIGAPDYPGLFKTRLLLKCNLTENGWGASEAGLMEAPPRSLHHQLQLRDQGAHAVHLATQHGVEFGRR